MKARLPQGYSAPRNNMSQMIKQAQKMQEQMEKAQEEINAKEYTTTVGGGVVEIKMTGDKVLRSITLKPEIVDPEAIEDLQDLIVSGVNEVLRQVESETETRMNDISGGLNIRKSAARLAYFVLDMPQEQAADFAASILEAKKAIHNCKVCQNLTDKEVCDICASDKRDDSVICVVESPRDVAAFERLQEYKGKYHVLHGLISPLDGVGPEQIKIKELLVRLRDTDVKEVIMATNPTIEGEATAMYIAKLLKPLGIQVTRLAFGIPVGGELEYTDNSTLNKALENRVTM